MRMRKIALLSLFFFGASLPVSAQELTPETVAEIWPYAETILKVKTSGKEVVKEEKRFRQAKVITQSTDTELCTAYESLFELSDAGWLFDSTVKEYEVSCRSHRAKGTPKKSAISEKTIAQ